MIRKERKARWVYRCSPCDYTSPASVDMFGAQEWQLRHDRSAAWLHVEHRIREIFRPLVEFVTTAIKADEHSQQDYALAPVPDLAPVRPPVQLACAETVWDGPYKMTCGYLIVFGKCVRHGPGGLTYIVPSDSPAVRAPKKGKNA